MRTRSLLACAALVPWATAARAEPSPSALELSGGWGVARMLLPSPDASRELSSQNGGLSLHARLVLRTPGGLSPLLDVGHTPLYRSDERLASGAVIRSSLSASHGLFGLALGSSWLRPWVALGAYRLEVRSSLGGVTITPTEWTFGYAAGLDVTVVRRGAFTLSLGAQALALSEAETLAMTAGASLGWDAIAW